MRYRQTEFLRRLEVDDELKRRRLLHRQIGRLRAVEDLAGVDTGLMIGGGYTRGVADEASGESELAGGGEGPPAGRQK